MRPYSETLDKILQIARDHFFVNLVFSLEAGAHTLETMQKATQEYIKKLQNDDLKLAALDKIVYRSYISRLEKFGLVSEEEGKYYIKEDINKYQNIISNFLYNLFELYMYDDKILDKNTFYHIMIVVKFLYENKNIKLTREEIPNKLKKEYNISKNTIDEILKLLKEKGFINYYDYVNEYKIYIIDLEKAKEVYREIETGSLSAYRIKEIAKRHVNINDFYKLLEYIILNNIYYIPKNRPLNIDLESTFKPYINILEKLEIIKGEETRKNVIEIGEKVDLFYTKIIKPVLEGKL
ncbi:hypothetical protein MJ1_0337 [Nanobdella aerobiophila]|uniref:Uncharacterized protein n=1 Tax=Nanobdella aerobiophila TaxID=2586965 RepID=A0A915SA45_9ARCH|nr:hypothetical protein [Nanobdella aerobiophila]BBL45502.1 hypothetical protein MJ1_0337 [Nanobdella aerobiophila]